jgi:mxaK protein
MRRTAIHIAFGTLALCCAGVAGVDAFRLQHAQRINEAVTRASAPASRPAPADASDPPAVRLAHAVALSNAGAYAAAGNLYDGLIDERRLDDIGQAALFDLGNMYLRQGAGGGTIRSVPMIEQAKARYRMLLRAAPDDWDTRYNLERALWLAPETADSADDPDVKERHNVTVRDAQSEDLP